jgi:helicase SWR1
MEKEEKEDGNQSDDSEMAGLADDADMPIEELMRKYGYGGGGEEAAPAETAVNGAAESPLPKEEEAEEAEEAASSPPKEEEVEEVEEEEEEIAPVTKQISVQPPFLLRAKLRPYQQAGLEWLASLYAGGINGFVLFLLCPFQFY